VVINIKKQRRKALVPWNGTKIEVALDTVDGLGTFVELETSAQDVDLDFARQQLASLAEVLGLARNERLSYCELLLKQRNES
jgi:predicted adenylyl cyclase CyaB